MVMRKLVVAITAAALLCVCAAGAESRSNVAVIDYFTPMAPIKPLKAQTLPAARAENAASGEAVSGGLKKVLGRVLRWEGDDKTVYIASSELLTVKGLTLGEVAGVSFLPDPEAFSAEEYEVYVSDITPKMAIRNKKKKKNAPAALYVRVMEKAPEETPNGAQTDGSGPSAGMEIGVKAEDYRPGIWASRSPKFTLTGIPSGDARYSYAVIAYDERFVILSKDVFQALDEGEYSLRFTILDGIGDIAASSDVYELMLDFTPPINLYVNMLQGSKKKFAVSAEDQVSGVDAYSVDGGYSWHKPEKSGGYIHSSKPGYTFAAGSIMARDKAGNIAVYPGDFTLPEKTSGGGGGGGKSDKVKHSPPGASDFDPYDTLKLKLPKGEMTTLTVGDARLPLTLEDEKGRELSFGANFASWGTDAENAKIDTLVLTSSRDDGRAIWKFNGVVYKMLANSGIDYMCFRQGDGAAAVKTSGFTAGAAYSKLKAQGVSTKKFDYTISQKGVSADFSVTVKPDEGIAERFALTNDAKSKMYLYDAVWGDAGITRLPFGADEKREERQ